MAADYWRHRLVDSPDYRRFLATEMDASIDDQTRPLDRTPVSQNLSALHRQEMAMSDEVDCPACGDRGTYWEDRVPVHDSIVGFEIREAGIRHSDGRLCTDW